MVLWWSTWMITLISKMCDFRPHPRPTHCIQREVHGACFSVRNRFLHCAEWSVKVSYNFTH
jgi:hypothetical protein